MQLSMTFIRNLILALVSDIIDIYILCWIRTHDLLGVIVYALSSSTCWQADFLEFEATVVYILSSRLARVT